MPEIQSTARSKLVKAQTSSETLSQSSRPGGKLGKLVERLETAEGATLAELTGLTGWQSHTMRAALTRLRQGGFLIRLEDRDGRRAYRLGAGEG